jgi:hypothetical protein
MGEEIDERDAASMRSRFARLEAQLEAAFDELAAAGESATAVAPAG